MLALRPDLLAPGDGKSAGLDLAAFHFEQVRSAEFPNFATAYDGLWDEFGTLHELEPREVLAARFALAPLMRYEMILVWEENRRDLESGYQSKRNLAAIRDHTAIWHESEVIVHLSHVLVYPAWRRSGLAGWMRALPIVTARELASEHHAPGAPITLLAEMEYDDGTDPKCAIRLAAYERAGYWKIDPGAVRYHQPDFRLPAVIDATGGPRPLPFQLLLRQVGHEGERTLSGSCVRRFVRALYAMYGAQFRADDMAHPLLRLDEFPADEEPVALVPPTQPATRKT